MSQRLIPFTIICFVILGFSKLMSLLNNDSSIIEAMTIHADNQNTDTVQEVNKIQPRKIEKVEIVKTNGQVVGTVYNLDTSQIQNISMCQKLYDLNFSNEEIEILQKLRQRREEIDKKNNDLLLLETALQSMQQKVDEKVVQLEKLNVQIEEKMSSGNIATDNTQASKLVRIYEVMKPKDAAKIFDDLQMGVLLEVSQKMKDNKLAAIVAEMQPQKARDLTMALASSRRGLDFD